MNADVKLIRDRRRRPAMWRLRRRSLIGVAALMGVCLAQGQSQRPAGAVSHSATNEPESKQAVVSAAAPASRVALPPIRHKPYRVLLIGDSISLGYFPLVQEALKGEAVVVSSGQAQGTRFVGENFDQILATGGGDWEVIHFNAGLHDVKQNRIVPIDEYEKNLRDIIRRLKAAKARIVWASTTPLLNEQLDKDVVEYNAAAKKIMDASGIPIDDLYTLARPRMADVHRGDGMHFAEAGSKLLANSVADSIRAAVGKGHTPGRSAP